MSMSLEGCKRCPKCHLIPEVQFEAPGIWLACNQHGYRAVGDTLDKAVKHWNRFISYVTGQEVAESL